MYVCITFEYKAFVGGFSILLTIIIEIGIDPVVVYCFNIVGLIIAGKSEQTTSKFQSVSQITSLLLFIQSR